MLYRTWARTLISPPGKDKGKIESICCFSKPETCSYSRLLVVKLSMMPPTFLSMHGCLAESKCKHRFVVCCYTTFAIDFRIFLVIVPFYKYLFQSESIDSIHLCKQYCFVTTKCEENANRDILFSIQIKCTQIKVGDLKYNIYKHKTVLVNSSLLLTFKTTLFICCQLRTMPWNWLLFI